MSMKGKGGKGGKGGGGGKSRSGGGAVIITKTKARETGAINSAIVTLRKALFDDEGRNTDVTAGIAPAFLRYDRKGLDVAIKWSAKLSKEEVRWAFAAIKEGMEEKYDASGYGWDDDDKMAQLMEPEARFLVVRESVQEKEQDEEDQPSSNSKEDGAGGGGSNNPAGGQQQQPVAEDDEKKQATESATATTNKKSSVKKAKKKQEGGPLVAIVHFRFTVQGEFIDEMCGEPSLIVWDLHVDTASRRKGLARHLLTLLELIARRAGMRYISLPVQLGDDATASWVGKAGRGAYVVDSEGGGGLPSSFDAQMEGFHVYSKDLAPPC